MPETTAPRPASSSPSVDREMLEDYLNQHLLGSRPGVQAFRAAAQTWADTPHEATLTRLAERVEARQDRLRALIESLGFSTPPTARALGAVAAAGGRLNPVNALRSRGTGWAQVELEVLMGALRSQTEMWRLLEHLAPYEPALDAAEMRRAQELTLEGVEQLQHVVDATLTERFLR